MNQEQEMAKKLFVRIMTETIAEICLKQPQTIDKPEGEGNLQSE